MAPFHFDSFMQLLCRQKQGFEELSRLQDKLEAALVEAKPGDIHSIQKEQVAINQKIEKGQILLQPVIQTWLSMTDMEKAAYDSGKIKSIIKAIEQIALKVSDTHNRIFKCNGANPANSQLSATESIKNKVNLFR